MTDDLRRRLAGSGYRLTPQRELVLRAVESLGHATPDEVLAEVRQHSSAVNVSTVYRNLEVLEELGLVRHAHLSDLVCRSCRRVVSVGAEAASVLTGRLADEHGFTADIGHLTVFGTCAECAREEQP
jgi:Fur family ferric uptake transcriptional regulator